MWLRISMIVPILAYSATWASSETLTKPTRPKVSEEAVLEYGKALDIAQLDPALPSEPLGRWFFSIVGPRADFLEWKSIPCGLVKDPGPDAALCLRGQAKWRQDRAVIVATIDVRVATMTSALSERPEVYEVSVWTVARDGASPAEADSIFGIWDGKRLGELKELLEKATVRARGKP